MANMQQIDELRFGTAGIPLSTMRPNTLNGIQMARELKLGAMELEFVHSINVKKENAQLVKETAVKNDVVLTAHASYYINLNSNDRKKLADSKSRIIDAARILSLCGGWSLCFHSGFYMGSDPNKAFARIRDEIRSISSVLRKENINIWLRPELTGKPTQFGDLNEIVRLSSEIENVLPCIDFAHYHARTGNNNSYTDFSSLFSNIEKSLGKNALKNMHIHIAGINYSKKGELNHLNLKDSDMNYMDLIRAFKDFNIKGVVISESPNIEEDALLLKNIFSK